MASRELTAARVRKDDEFYTRMEDIEKELRHYPDDFRGRVVYCNCDDPYESAFVKYFVSKFHDLGLRKLLVSSIKGLWAEYNGEGELEVRSVPDGDFRGPYALSLLDKADVVVTNPPFSKAKEFIDVLVRSGKRFLIIVPSIIVVTKAVFPHFKAGKFWVGKTSHAGGMWFRVREERLGEPCTKRYPDGNVYKNIGFVTWVTNLGAPPAETPLVEEYDPSENPTYENYNAVEVSRVSKIPKDFYGLMGVPVSFVTRYNPNQFELVDVLPQGELQGRRTFKRLVIRRRLRENPTDFLKRGMIAHDDTGKPLRP